MTLLGTSRDMFIAILAREIVQSMPLVINEEDMVNLVIINLRKLSYDKLIKIKRTHT